MDATSFSELERLFLAMSDRTRLRLLELMSAGEVSVGDLALSLGESQPKISRHLAYLRSAGIVTTRRDGKWIFYAIDERVGPAAMRVLDATFNGEGIEARREKAVRKSEMREKLPGEPMPESTAAENAANGGASEEMDVWLL